MRISWLNSKKCSIHEAAIVALLGCLCWPALSQASVSASKLYSELRDLRAKEKSGSFEAVLRHWESTYGSEAVSPLVKIARNRNNEDTNRYVAIMGAAKLGGREVAPALVPLLNDPSWMVRVAALRALGALKHPDTVETIKPLLKDPALVVRIEAVDTVEKLRPKGTQEALLEALGNKENYHAGKAQWVPQRILNVLLSIKDPSVAPKLQPLLDHAADPELQRMTILTLEGLTGKSFRSQASLKGQIQEWKKLLSQGQTVQLQ